MSDLAGLSLPPIGSRWTDTEGEDGEIVVDGYDKGCYVLASGPRVSGWAYINVGQFGGRYERIDGGDHV